MAVYLCHEQPDLYEHGATVVDALPGRVVLDRSAFHPGGGGQVSDIGTIEHGGGVVAVVGIETVDDVVWHLLGGDGTALVQATSRSASTPTTGRASPSCTPTRTSSTPSSTTAGRAPS